MELTATAGCSSRPCPRPRPAILRPQVPHCTGGKASSIASCSSAPHQVQHSLLSSKHCSTLAIVPLGAVATRALPSLNSYKYPKIWMPLSPRKLKRPTKFVPPSFACQSSAVGQRLLELRYVFLLMPEPSSLYRSHLRAQMPSSRGAGRKTVLGLTRSTVPSTQGSGARPLLKNQDSPLLSLLF